MKLYEELNLMLEMMETSPDKGVGDYIIFKTKITTRASYCIHKNNARDFSLTLHKVAKYDKDVVDRFLEEYILDFIYNKLVEYKINNKHFKQGDEKDFFKKLKDQKPYDCYVIAPISGIRLNKEDKKELSCFQIGNKKALKILQKDKADFEYYISVNLSKMYDNKYAIRKADSMFIDFINIISFLCSGSDSMPYIKVGTPVYCNADIQNHIYVNTDYYTIVEDLNSQQFPKSISADVNYAEKIPIDDDFFACNPNYSKIWEIYGKDKPTDIEKRIISSVIYIGESNLHKGNKSSVLYSCMALETLFSMDEKTLFQSSIGERVSNFVAFMVCREKNVRRETIKEIKDFYSLRSALVHGGEKRLDNSYSKINLYLKMAISELLCNDKYKNIKTIKDLYDMMEDARNSY